MATYLLTIKPEDFVEGVFTPGIRLSRFRNEEVLGRIGPGRRVQLRRSDGSAISMMIENVSIDGLVKEGYSYSDDASFYSCPNDPLIRLVFRSAITAEIASVGTTVWLLD